MRIGIFSDRYLPQTDGISYSIETFRVELEKLGHEVYIFCPRPSWRYKDKSKRIIRFAAVKGLFFDDWLTTFFFPPQAIKQIDKLKLDIIHFQTPSQIGMLGAYYALHKHIPLVTTYHTDLFNYVKHYPQVLPGSVALSLLIPVVTGGSIDEYREAFSSMKPETNLDKWNQKIIVRSLTLVHNHCDLVITPSRKFENQLHSWDTTSRIVTLPTGVDKITTIPRDMTAIRNKFGLKSSDKIILLVCRIGTEKNIDLLIKSFEIIGERLPEAKLVIAGPGDDLEFYQKQAAKSAWSDRIIFTGFIDRHKLGALYDRADVFAFPSLADTQGMTINEAACAGVPVVMVDQEISEVVKNGENGYFARSTPRDFAAKIITVLTNERLHQKMSRRSTELARDVSAASQGAKMLELYQETIRSYRKQHQAPKLRLFRRPNVNPPQP